MQTPAADATPTAAWCSMPVHEMMHGIELDQADKNEIDRDNVIQQSRDEQDEDAGKDSDERREMGGGNDHGFSSRVATLAWNKKARWRECGKTCSTKNARPCNRF
jgi:hypothetical protein